MQTFLPFFIILLSSVVFATVFSRINLPWVVGLIVAGILVGPQGFEIIQTNETISFIGEFGLIFLMFMAGLETRLKALKKFNSQILPLAFINGFIPFLTGYGIAYLFGYPPLVSLLVGIIFVSSSIAIIIPILDSNQILKSKLGQAIVATSIIQDVASLFLLSIFLQAERPLANIPLHYFYPLLFFNLLAMRFLLPKIEAYFTKKTDKRFQTDVRSTFTVLLGTVLLFEILGLHSIIAGFFAGFVLSDTIKSKEMKDRLKAIGYGVFIPTFFVIVGIETDIGVFANVTSAGLFTFVIVAGSILSKFFSGTLGAKILGFNNSQSMLFGASSVPQLSTTLAATYSAQALGIISSEIVTAMVFLSIFTTLIGPSFMGLFIKTQISNKDLKDV